MKPVTVTTTIERPREDVHAVLEDLMNHEAFTDHFLTDFQRTETGIRVKGKGGGGWMEITPVESTPDPQSKTVNTSSPKGNHGSASYASPDPP